MISKLDEELERLREVADRPQATLGDEFLFLCALGKWFRAGQLVPAQPSGDVVKAVARAIMVAKGGKCLVIDWSIERRDNPHVALAWDQATAAITTYEAVSGVAKMREEGVKIGLEAAANAIQAIVDHAPDGFQGRELKPVVALLSCLDPAAIAQAALRAQEAGDV